MMNGIDDVAVEPMTMDRDAIYPAAIGDVAAGSSALQTIPGIDPGAFAGRTLVVKYGGAAMGEESFENDFAADVAALASAGVKVVVVHGGGNEITALASALGIQAEFIGGHRRNSDAMLDVATMVLAGKVNKGLVRRIAMAGGRAVGICGIDGGLLVARKLAGLVDLGRVGEVEAVNTNLLDLLTTNGMIPVVAPVGIGADGSLYNINADLAAGAVAGALGADALIYMSNIAGIAADGAVLPSLVRSEADALIERGAITGGMLPKVASALAAIDAGVKSVWVGRTEVRGEEGIDDGR